MRRRQRLQEPDVGDRRRQGDVAHALAADLRLDDLDAALLAHDAAVLHALVLAAVALVVLDRTEDLGAEEPVAFRLERPVVDRLRLLHLAERPLPDLVRGRERDPERVERQGVLGLLEEIVEITQWWVPLRVSCDVRSVEPCQEHRGLSERRSAGAPQRPCPSDWRPLFAHLDVEAEGLQLLHEHVEALGQTGLERVLALHDRFVHARPALHVVRLHRQELLQTRRRRRTPRAPRPPSRRGADHRTAPCRPAAAG